MLEAHPLVVEEPSAGGGFKGVVQPPKTVDQEFLEFVVVHQYFVGALDEWGVDSLEVGGFKLRVEQLEDVVELSLGDVASVLPVYLSYHLRHLLVLVVLLEHLQELLNGDLGQFLVSRR